jgi:uncharacterized protein YndB with AHSA1/START domain
MNAEDNSIVCECDLPDPPEKVWAALTDPQLLAQWLMPNDMRPEVGSRFRFEPSAESPDGPIECEVLEMRPNQLLRYTWRTAADEPEGDDHPLDSIVTFELTTTPAGGTHLRVIHAGFAQCSPVACASASQSHGLSSLASSHTNVVPFPSRPRGMVGTQAQWWMVRWAA